MSPLSKESFYFNFVIKIIRTCGRRFHMFENKLLHLFKNILHFQKLLFLSEFLHFIFKIWNIFVDTFSEMHILFQVD
jgi:hypothetical protein